MQDVKTPVTRFAPSPTGFLHIGGARTALFNWLFSKKYGGKFILRIEDTDVQRNNEDAAGAILSSLEWLGLNWDEGPFYQSRRVEVYKKYAKMLVDRGFAYRCFCAQERLNEMKKDQKETERALFAYDRRCCGISKDESDSRAGSGEAHAVRFKITGGAPVQFNDMVHGGLSFNRDILDDFVIIKSDGMPAYNFAVAIDDYEMGVTHVIRGDDHISNTPKQILIFNALEIAEPRYGHVPMILGEDKTKLSKRHGATSLGWYEQAGYIREAVINYLALLGWSFDDKAQYFETAELIEKFDEKKFGKTSAVFDVKKLDYFNQQHLKNMNIDSKASLIFDYIKRFMPSFKYEEKYFTHEYFKKTLLALGDRLRVLPDFAVYASFFFIDNLEYGAELIERTLKGMSPADACGAIEKIITILESCREFEACALESETRAVKLENVNFSKMMLLMRSALCAQAVSPGMFDVAVILGRERSCERLRNFMKRLAAH